MHVCDPGRPPGHGETSNVQDVHVSKVESLLIKTKCLDEIAITKVA